MPELQHDERNGGDWDNKGPRVFRFSWRPSALILASACAAFGLLSLVNRQVNWVAFGLLMVLPLPVAAYFAMLAVTVRLVIDEKGVAFHERSAVSRVTWDDLHGVGVAKAPGRKGVRQYRLFSMGQVVLQFENEIADSERAFRTIERRISVALYPRYRDALERGETVSFGNVVLGRSTITVRHVNVPLAEAKLVRRDGDLALHRRGHGDPLIIVPEGDVQNVNILMRCLRELDPRVLGAAA